MSDALQERASRLLDRVASGVFDPDEIGNVVRDLLRALRLRRDGEARLGAPRVDDVEAKRKKEGRTKCRRTTR